MTMLNPLICFDNFIFFKIEYYTKFSFHAIILQNTKFNNFSNDRMKSGWSSMRFIYNGSQHTSKRDIIYLLKILK